MCGTILEIPVGTAPLWELTTPVPAKGEAVLTDTELNVTMKAEFKGDKGSIGLQLLHILPT